VRALRNRGVDRGRFRLAVVELVEMARERVVG
jgi:hypothetical protein